MNSEEYLVRKNELTEPWKRQEDPNQLELPIPWNSPDAGEGKTWRNGPPPKDPNPYACLGRDVEDG